MKVTLILPAVFSLLASATLAHRPDARVDPRPEPRDAHHRLDEGHRRDHHGPSFPARGPHDLVHAVLARAAGGDCGPFADLFAKTVLVSVAAHEDKAAEKVEPRAFCEEMVATAKGLEEPQAFPLGEDTLLLHGVVSLKSNATLDATAILTLNAAKLDEMHHPPPPHPEDAEVPEPPVVPAPLEGVVGGATVVYGAKKTGPLAEQVKALFKQLLDAALKADGKNCEEMFPGQLDGVTADFAIHLAAAPHRPEDKNEEPQGPSVCEMAKYMKEHKIVDGSLKAVPLSDTKAAVFWDVEPRQPPHHPRPPRFEDAEEGEEETAALMDAFETEEEMRAEEVNKVHDSVVAKKVNAKETQATARMLEKTDEKSEGHEHGKGKKNKDRHDAHPEDRRPPAPRHSMAAVVELSADAKACDAKSGRCQRAVSRVTVMPLSLAAMALHARHRFMSIALLASVAVAAVVLAATLFAVRMCRKRRASGLTPFARRLGNGEDNISTPVPSAPLLEEGSQVADV